jgi:hypothetical protein
MVNWRKGRTKENDPVVAKVAYKLSLKRGPATSMWGRKHSDVTKQKMREARLKNPVYFVGDSHWNWHGGSSFEPYSKEWTKELKKQIRERDNYKCQLCGIKETEYYQKLSVHHIDYNKNNLNENNLVSLCRKCHIKTNCKRDYWISIFKNKRSDLLWPSLSGLEK